MAGIAVFFIKVYVAFCGCVDYVLNVIESSCKRIMGGGYSSEQQQNAAPGEEKPRKKHSTIKEEKPDQSSKNKKSPDKKKRFDKNRNSVAVSNFIVQVESSTQTEHITEQIKEALKLLVKQTQTDIIEKCDLNTSFTQTEIAESNLNSSFTQTTDSELSSSFTQTDIIVPENDNENERELEPTKVEQEVSTVSQQTEHEMV